MEVAQVNREQRAPRSRPRMVAILGGLGVVLLIIALAFPFITSTSTREVAANATALHEVDAAVATVALTRAAVAQAIVFGIDHELGVASAEAFEIAHTAATSALLNASELASALKDTEASQGLGTDLEDFSAAGNQIIGLLLAGEVLEAEALRDEVLEPSYVQLSASMSARRELTLDKMARTENLAGIVSGLTQFIAMLLIPTAAVMVYFLVVRRQMREARISMDAQIEAQQQVGRSKDDFIASISHELRTPLTSIYGFSEYLVATDALDPEETVELVALIHEDSVELSRMIEDLLTAARVESDALKFAYDYVDLRVETLAATGAMTRSGSTVQVMGDVLCWADANRVRQIVRNLVSNAIKHGGPIVDVYLETDGDRAVLTVSDNGAVMDPDLEKRMFDRFVHDGVETLLTGSVGLGLSIARSLARTMGGDIRFVRAGGWTNFEVSLPRKDGVPIEVPAAAQEPIVTDGPFAERVLAAYS